MVLVGSKKFPYASILVAPTPITETRLIYTQGVYVLSDAMRSCRQITIYTDLLRFPKFTVYANEKSNPPYYFLGYYTVWMGDYVENRYALEFTEQAVFTYDNPVLQLSNLLLAAATNIGDTVQALGTAMTPPAIIVFLPQPPASAEGCPYTRIKFKMPLGTRIQVTAIGIPLEPYGTAQQVNPSLHQPSDEVPRYPLDRDPSLDPARSPAYSDELPGDTAPATSDDPDAGYEPPPPPLAPCWHVIGQGATSTNTPGTDLVGNGTFYPSWIRANTLSVTRRLVVGGYYNGCYAQSLVIDGVVESGYGATISVSLDPDNPNCPTS